MPLRAVKNADATHARQNKIEITIKGFLNVGIFPFEYQYELGDEH